MFYKTSVWKTAFHLIIPNNNNDDDDDDEKMKCYKFCNACEFQNSRISLFKSFCSYFIVAFKCLFPVI